MSFWSPFILSLQLACITTLILLILAIPLANWLSQTRSKFKAIIEALVSLPLVLPPTVLGFYFLIAFSPGSAPGAWLNDVLGIQLVFSFEGLVVASVIYSLPFMVQPLHSGFSQIPQTVRESSLLMPRASWQNLFRVLIPNMKAALLSGVVLSFAHTIGEFGVILMIGGSIPDQTRVASIAIYEEVESMNYAMANTYAGMLVLVSFLTLLLVYLFNGGFFKRFAR